LLFLLLLLLPGDEQAGSPSTKPQAASEMMQFTICWVVLPPATSDITIVLFCRVTSTPHV
jgi:hypothetical protein